MGQIIISLASVCLCVCHRSCGRNFESNLMRLCTVVWGRKTKIEFGGVKTQNPIVPSPIYPQYSPIFINSNAFSMERFKYCCAVSTPVDQLWWFTWLIYLIRRPSAASRDALPKMTTLNAPPQKKSYQNYVQCIYNANMHISQMTHSVTMRDRVLVSIGHLQETTHGGSYCHVTDDVT